MPSICIGNRFLRFPTVVWQQRSVDALLCGFSRWCIVMYNVASRQITFSKSFAVATASVQINCVFIGRKSFCKNICCSKIPHCIHAVSCNNVRLIWKSSRMLSMKCCKKRSIQNSISRNLQHAWVMRREDHLLRGDDYFDGLWTHFNSGWSKLRSVEPWLSVQAVILFVHRQSSIHSKSRLRIIENILCQQL